MDKSEKKIVIAERDNIAAVMEGKKVEEFFVTRGEVLLGDIYLATVENILPSIEAAFVDVGVDKMGFLHAQDVIGKGSLKEKLSPKQKLVVQVVKEPTGHKGPRVTTEISLPGRFLVLIPNETGVNVSRKIESVKEKARLKSIVNLIKPVGVGVIIRTEAEGQSDADIQEDLEILLEKWNNIVTAAESLTPPSLISRDQDLLYRVLREACTEDVSEIIVDTAFALNRVQQLLQNWHMNRNINITLYKGSEPLLVAMDVHKEIKAALQTKVNMPSGGYLFIQTTEALTVIDVNSGKFTSSATQDETILLTNKEAVHEIARQLRLRNIGGMIIIDFIDMNTRVDKLAMMEELELALQNDKAKPQVGQLSDLGLVEMTRHRQGQSISEIFTKKCPHCQGNGYVMEDFKFATPTSEGEFRAKASKMKLNNNFKKKPMNMNQNSQQGSQNNQQNTQQGNQQGNFQGNSQFQQNDEMQEAQSQQLDNRNRNNNKNKRNKFNKNRNRDFEQNQNPQAVQMQAQPVMEASSQENQTEKPVTMAPVEIKPEKKEVEKPKVQVEQAKDIKSEAKQEVKQEAKLVAKSEEMNVADGIEKDTDKSKKKPRGRKAKAKQAEEKQKQDVETPVLVEASPIEVKEVDEKPKKTRKPRVTKKAVKDEEKA